MPHHLLGECAVDWGNVGQSQRADQHQLQNTGPSDDIVSPGECTKVFGWPGKSQGTEQKQMAFQWQKLVAPVFVLVAMGGVTNEDKILQGNDVTDK
jgi:hypothetical protein